MLQEGPIPRAVNKSLIQLNVFLLFQKEYREKEGSEAQTIIYSLLARGIGAFLSFMLCGLPSWLHPGTSQQNRVIYSTLHVFALSSGQCGKLFTGSPGTDNDQL